VEKIWSYAQHFVVNVNRVDGWLLSPDITQGVVLWKLGILAIEHFNLGNNFSSLISWTEYENADFGVFEGRVSQRQSRSS
jgi:hypothetical protein